MEKRESVIKKYLVLSLLSGILMGCIFPFFSLLFVAEFKNKSSFILFTCSCLLAGVVVGLSSFLIGKITIIGTIKKLAKELLCSVGNDDLTKRVEVASNDDIGEIAHHFNVFVEKIHTIISRINFDAENVVTSVIKINAFFNQISINTDKISTQTSTVASAAEQASININSISSAIKDISASAHSVTTAIEEIGESIHEVARNCKKELNFAVEANTHAKLSKNVMEKLGATARSIGKIVDVINDIAEKTNLLALNATIEAVSAGDAGNGFKVVAGEVKALAKQTALATVEVKQQITEMQTNTELALKAIDFVSRVIEEVNVISQTIVSAVEVQRVTMDEISHDVSRVSQGTQEMSNNVAGSASGLSEVSSMIAGVNYAVAHTGKGIVAMKENTAELSNLSKGLTRLLGQFKLK
jgi:methyl-accepting chemotaxis protein